MSRGSVKRTSEGHERKSEHGPSLGNKHEFRGGQSSGYEDLKTAEARKVARLERYALQSISRVILPYERVAKCLRVRISSDVDIWKTRDARFHYGGLITCGSIWACPICASKISERRKGELIQAMANWRQIGGEILFLTQTIPHYAHDHLKPLLAKFGRARRLMRNRATWRTWAKPVGLQGIIKALEITHTKNGWHIHTHELLFVRPGLECLVEAERLLPFWQSACVTAGLPEPNGHGLTVEDGSKASAYVTKWGIEDELTKAHIKKSKGEKEGRHLISCGTFSKTVIWNTGSCLKSITGLLKARSNWHGQKASAPSFAWALKRPMRSLRRRLRRVPLCLLS